MSHRGRLRDKLEAAEKEIESLRQALARAQKRDAEIDRTYQDTIADLRRQLDVANEREKRGIPGS